MRRTSWTLNHAGFPDDSIPIPSEWPKSAHEFDLIRTTTESGERVPNSSQTFRIHVWYNATPRGVMIRAVEGVELTATLLKELRLGTVETMIQEMLSDRPHLASPKASAARYLLEIADSNVLTADQIADYQAALDEARANVPPPKDRPRKGRAPTDRDFLGRLTANYLDVRFSRTSTKDLVAIYDEEPTDTRKVRRWLESALRHGFLRRSEDGKQYEPGPEYGTWLKEQAEGRSDISREFAALQGAQAVHQKEMASMEAEIDAIESEEEDIKRELREIERRKKEQ